MTVKLLTDQHLVLLSLKEDSTGSSESTHVKMTQCWKSHVAAFKCVCVYVYLTAVDAWHSISCRTGHGEATDTSKCSI